MDPFLTCFEMDTVILECETKDEKSNVKWLKNNEPISDKDDRYGCIILVTNVSFSFIFCETLLHYDCQQKAECQKV